MDVSTIPGMNPPAPEPVAGPSGSEAAGQTMPGNTPDYAALLQYLQYYQKQMGSEEAGK
jgi:hypothetical protein